MAKIFNKGKRRIVYGHVIVDGKSVEHDVHPQKQKTVSTEEAATLKRLFPDEIVDLDSKEDMQSQFKESSVQHSEPVITVAEAEKQKQAAIDEAVAAALESLTAPKVDEETDEKTSRKK